MTTPSRRRALAESLNQQLADFRARGELLQRASSLLLEYIDRAVGFAQLSGVNEDDLAGSDHCTLVALTARAVLSEIERKGGHVAEDETQFRATLLKAILSPDAGTLGDLRASAELLVQVVKMASPPETLG